MTIEKSNGSAAKNKKINGKMRRTNPTQQTGKYLHLTHLELTHIHENMVILISLNSKRLVRSIRTAERGNIALTCSGNLLKVNNGSHFLTAKLVTTGMNQFALDLNGDSKIENKATTLTSTNSLDAQASTHLKKK